MCGICGFVNKWDKERKEKEEHDRILQEKIAAKKAQIRERKAKENNNASK